MHRNRLLDLEYEPPAELPSSPRPRPRPVAAVAFLLVIVAALVAANLALLVHHFGTAVLHHFWPW